MHGQGRPLNVLIAREASVHVSKPVDFDDFTGVVKQIEEFFGNIAELPGD
jgi:hypothetical protein